MADFVDMTLKILYTLDDGSNSVSYLARSKKPKRVRIVSIPNPNDLYSNNNILNHSKINKLGTTISPSTTTTANNNNSSSSNFKVIRNNSNNINEKFNGLNNNDCDINLNVGLINLSTVLKEIYINSPEVLQIDDNCNSANHNSSSSNNNAHTQISCGSDVRIDYNVYYRDICEVNEPLVSLGLLSDIQSKLNKLHHRHNNNNSNSDSKRINNDNIEDIYMQEELEEQEYDNDKNKENEDMDEDMDEDEDLIVIGRVCSNFSALLRRSYSNSHNNKTNKNINNNNKNSKERICMDTLEIKLKFSKIVLPKKPKSIPRTSTMARRQNTTVISPLSIASPATSTTSRTAASETNLTPQYSVPPLPKKVNKTVKQRRQTNPMPAPKAKRTQSLPVWNLNASGMGLRNGKTSIAHKIFMADRLMEENNSNSFSTYPKTQMFTYEINSLQNDNTIQRNIVDDSVSKRFDFMNKKLNNSNNSNGNSPLNVGGITSKQATTKTKKSKTIRKPKTKGKSTNTTTTLKNKKRSQSQSQNAPVLINDSFVDVDSNKENVPPLNNNLNDDDDDGVVETNVAPLAERMDTKLIDPIHTDQLDLYSLNFDENALNWFEDVTKNQSNNKETMTPAFIFDNETLKFNDIMSDHNNKNHFNNNNNTNNNNNNNNTVTPRDIIDDPDRTSPLDTLSMPLMELEQAHSSLANLSSEDGLVHDHHNTGSIRKVNKHITTCQEQLNRLPILAPSYSNLSQHNSTITNNNNNNNKKPRASRNYMDDTPKESNHMDDVVGSEATILLNYNTSPINTLPNDNSSKSNLRNINNYQNNNDEFDEEEKKRQRTLPSSPSLIFEYRSTSLQIDEDDGDTGNNENMTPDLFTKFMDQNRDKMDNVNGLDQLDVLPNIDNKLESDFNEMRFSNDGIYTPATTVHFTSDEK